MENTRQDAPDKDNAAQPAQGDSTQPQQNGTAQPVNLMTELIDAQKKADEYLEALRRERAEFMNFRKRKEREGDEIYQNATAERKLDWKILAGQTLQFYNTVLGQ